jgi:hypothetical protein
MSTSVTICECGAHFIEDDGFEEHLAECPAVRDDPREARIAELEAENARLRTMCELELPEAERKLAASEALVRELRAERDEARKLLAFCEEAIVRMSGQFTPEVRAVLDAALGRTVAEPVE